MSVSEKEGKNRHPQSHPSHLERGVHEAVDVAAQAPANTDAHGGLASRVDAHAAASSSRLMLFRTRPRK